MDDILATLVNLERYPLLDDFSFASIAANCQRQLREESFASLPGFLRAGIAEQMVVEVTTALPRAYRREREQSAYDERAPDLSDKGEVRQRTHLNRQYVVPNDILRPRGLLCSLYHSETLTRRIAQILAEPALFTLTDPVMACTSTVMFDGDTHGWHFDLNDFVVSILLQPSNGGGAFEFVPDIRSDGDENYANVAEVMDGRSAALRSVNVEAGTLLLFCGRRALHRVSPIHGNTPRVIALFSYDRVPGVRYDSDVYRRVVGREHVFVPT